MKMMKTTKLALIVCLTLLIHKSAFSAACDEKLFSQPNADFSEKKDDFVTKNQVFFEIKDTFWSITKYTFKNTPVTKEQYPLFANIIHLRDNEKVSQQWYKNSRYDVLEAFMYHETELVKTIQRENGSSFYVVDATFDNKVSRFAYTAEFENNKYQLFQVMIISDEERRPPAKRILTRLKRFKLSCAENT